MTQYAANLMPIWPKAGFPLLNGGGWNLFGFDRLHYHLSPQLTPLESS
jgi:hypothetical protein